jgi:hypothetical protein
MQLQIIKIPEKIFHYKLPLEFNTSGVAIIRTSFTTDVTVAIGI